METIRKITVKIVVDTNKRTEVIESDVDTFEEGKDVIERMKARFYD